MRRWLTGPDTPDITFCSQDISPLVQWKVVPEISSDHNPILIDIAILSPIPKKPTRNFLNYRKANWDVFTAQTEEALASFNPAGYGSLDEAIRKFSEIMLAASKGNIPAGFVKYVSLYSREVKLLMQERRHLLNRPPAQDITERINDLLDEIKSRLHDEAKHAGLKSWRRSTTGQLLPSFGELSGPSIPAK